MQGQAKELAVVGKSTDENASAALLGHTQADNQPSNLQILPVQLSGFIQVAGSLFYNNCN
jgi:hypothetical protein